MHTFGNYEVWGEREEEMLNAISHAIQVLEGVDKFRIYLWNTYGGDTRYGDDGELQGKHGDYKRMPLINLINKIIGDEPHHTGCVNDLEKMLRLKE